MERLGIGGLVMVGKISFIYENTPDTGTLLNISDDDGSDVEGLPGQPGLYPPAGLQPFNDSEIYGGQFYRGHNFYLTFDKSTLYPGKTVWLHESSPNYDELFAVHEIVLPHFPRELADNDRMLAVNDDRAVIITNINVDIDGDSALPPDATINATVVDLDGNILQSYDLYAGRSAGSSGTVWGGLGSTFYGSTSMSGDRVLFSCTDYDQLTTNPDFAGIPKIYVDELNLGTGEVIHRFDIFDGLAMNDILDPPADNAHSIYLEGVFDFVCMADGGTLLLLDNYRVVRLGPGDDILWISEAPLGGYDNFRDERQMTLSEDGTTVWAGGSFGSVGVDGFTLADQLDLTTGAVIRTVYIADGGYASSGVMWGSPSSPASGGALWAIGSRW